MAQKRKYIKFVTPAGIARWPKLHKKDVYEGKETKYNMGVYFDDAAWAKVKAAIKDAKTEIFGNKKPKGFPIKKDKESGNQYLQVSSHKKVPLFKAGKRPLAKFPESTIL